MGGYESGGWGVGEMGEGGSRENRQKKKIKNGVIKLKAIRRIKIIQVKWVFRNKKSYVTERNQEKYSGKRLSRLNWALN